MQTRIEGRDGWVEVSRDGVWVLAKGDDALRARLESALDAADGDDLADVITDELSTGGVRRTPDFALVDETSARVLVRGSASVTLVTAGGGTREVAAPARGPWADEDLEAGDSDAVIVTGEPQDLPEVAPQKSTVEAEPSDPPAAPVEAAGSEPVAEDAVQGGVADEEQAATTAASSASPGGWAVPSVFGGAPAAGPEQPRPERPSLSVVPDPVSAAQEHAGELPAPVVEAPTTQEPVEESTVVETPAPEGQDIVADQPESAEPLAPAPVASEPTVTEETGAESIEDPASPEPASLEPARPEAAASPGAPEDEDLPSFDFLFGNTNHHRSSLLSGFEEEEAEAEAIDSGPVAAAGGFQAPENPTNATLAPPSDDEEHHVPAASAPTGPTLGSLPGGLPPMPGSAPAAATEDPTEVEASSAATVEPAASDPTPQDVAPPEAGAPAAALPRPSFVQAARDDSSGHEPGAGRPQFADGHLVGSRVPQVGTSIPEPAMTVGPPPSSPTSEADAGGVISAVPWGEAGPAGPTPGLPQMPFGLPGLPTPDLGPAQPEPQAPAAGHDPAVDTGEIPSGPMVLAVRCSIGHHNAPHATRCRVCGQDLPTQQPEQTPRPALGLLRLSTGDVVTLDRGVLIGRAPRASAEASGARAPHLVRISSPDNEISRNHVEIVLDGWHVLVRDLGSTNGTTVALPGSSPVRVRPGDQQTIEPGTTVTLADQVSMVFEVTG